MMTTRFFGSVSKAALTRIEPETTVERKLTLSVSLEYKAIWHLAQEKTAFFSQLQLVLCLWT